MQLGNHSQLAIRDPEFPYFCCFSDVLHGSPCRPLTSAHPDSGAWNPASGIKPVAAARHEPRLQHVTDLRATSCDCRRQIILRRLWQLRTVNIRKHFDTFPGRNRRKPAISLDALECGSTNSSRSSLMSSGYRDWCRAAGIGPEIVGAIAGEIPASYRTRSRSR